MVTVLLVIHLMVVLALVAVVLLQRSEGGALGIGGGGGGGFFSSRGTANLLTRTTAILATIFFVTSLALGILAGTGGGPASIFGDAPVGPSGLPDNTRGSGQGILDTLRGGTEGGAEAPPAGDQPPAAPAAPTGPQVPNN